MTTKKIHSKIDTSAKNKHLLASLRAEAENEAAANKVAKLAISPQFSATAVIDACTSGAKLNPFALMAQLEHQHAGIAANNMAQAENMLMSQAVALQTIFASLAVRAMGSKGTDQLQSILGLALRAQSGCRATLQTLGELKSPRQTTFVKQANIARGPQQVNNGVATAASASPRAQEEIPDSTNKLSGNHHELRENTGAAGQAIAGHPVVETVEKVHRSKVQRG